MICPKLSDASAVKPKLNQIPEPYSGSCWLHLHSLLIQSQQVILHAHKMTALINMESYGEESQKEVKAKSE